jgi:hypothetical protein
LFVGCKGSGKNWKSEIDALFADVKAMHSQILVELTKSSRQPGDYEAATRIINQSESKIKNRFNEIMAASRWEVGNDEKSALKEKMMDYPSAAIKGIDEPSMLVSPMEAQESKDKFYRKYASLFSETTTTTAPTGKSLEDTLKAKNYPVEYADRKAVLFPASTKPDPLMLVVEIAGDGKLSLNKSEMGTIADPTPLSKKIKTIFKERENVTVTERGIVIDPKDKIKDEDMEKLVETLAAAKASPIRIIKSGV